MSAFIKKTYHQSRKSLPLFNTIIPNSIAGIVSGLIEIFYAITFASLVFSGPLEEHLPIGISICLISAIITFWGISIFSSKPGILSSVQDVPVVLLVVLTSSMASGMSNENILPSLLMIIVISSILTGAFMVALGILKLGGLGRYIPYPVIGGFLAATGWLIIIGTFELMTGFKLNSANLARYFELDHIIKWLPGFLIGIILLTATRKIKNPLVTPILLVVFFIAIHIFLFIAGISVSEASQMGLFFKGSASGGLNLFYLQQTTAINWYAILLQGANIAVILVMTLIGLLLNSTAIELDQQIEFDHNRELVAAGISNMVSGFAGGIIGYHAIGTTALSIRLGGRERIAGIIAGFVCLIPLMSEVSILGTIPKSLVGGILFLLGFDFLYTWVIAGWRKFTKIEYGIVIVILVLIGLTNFMIGLATGLICIVIMFVVSYSRTSIIHLSFSGSDLQSMVYRPPDQQNILTEFGRTIEVIELQGFLFFGTASKIVEHVKQRLIQSKALQLKFIILDFRMVSGMDSSAGISIYKCFQLAEANNFQLIFSNIKKNYIDRITTGGVILDDYEGNIFPTLDHALEWCEDQILVGDHHNQPQEYISLEEHLIRSGIPENLSKKMTGYFMQEQVLCRETLYRAGSEANDLCFILSGQISIFIKDINGNLHRVRTQGPGTTVGEIGFLLNSYRSADVVADKDTLYARINNDALHKMELESPETAIAFHRMASRQLAEIVLQINRTVRALRA